ncbi:MAG: hypothetical protein IJT21_00705 [Synergistaceae bacterium]|nr:hypothetical protein [Synergistaceae bacterium]
MQKFMKHSVIYFSAVIIFSCLSLFPAFGIENISSLDEFKANIGKSDVLFLDLRSEAAYQGWKIDGAVRGGHVKGASDFPISWLKLADDSRLAEIVARKGDLKGKTIILYGSPNDEEIARLEKALTNAGAKKVLLFSVPAEVWTADELIPMESYPRYELYVYPEWLNSLMSGGKVDNYDGRPFKVFEASWGEEKTSYANGHIPGTIHINTDEFEEGPIWNRLSDSQLKKVLEANGITKDTLVVLYSTTQNMAAARIAWIMMYCGVQDVRLLDGGFNAWKRAGLPVTTESTPKEPVKDFGAEVPLNRELILDLPEAKKLLENPNGRLVSIRTWEEQIGEVSGYAGWDLKGRISGDVWGHCGHEGSAGVSDFENIDGTMRNGDEITALWNEWGIRRGNEIATYCGTGWRAAEISFDFYVLGWPTIWIYDGGWYEWSSDPANPFLTGDQKPRFK